MQIFCKRGVVKMIKRTVYQCEHCKRFRKKPRIYFKSTDMYYHEFNCWYNVKNKTCFTCTHQNNEYHSGSIKSIGCEIGLINSCSMYLSDSVKIHCDKWREVEGE